MNHRGGKHSRTRNNERNAGIGGRRENTQTDSEPRDSRRPTFMPLEGRRLEPVSEVVRVDDYLKSIDADLGRYMYGSLGKSQLGVQIERDLGIVEKMLASGGIKEPQLADCRTRYETLRQSYETAKNNPNTPTSTKAYIREQEFSAEFSYRRIGGW